MNPWERYGKLLLWILLAASLHTILVGMAIRFSQSWLFSLGFACTLWVGAEIGNRGLWK